MDCPPVNFGDFFDVKTTVSLKAIVIEMSAKCQ